MTQDPHHPDSPIDLTRWEALAGPYEELARRPLDAAGVPAWLDDWSALAAKVRQAGAWLSIRHTQDTADEERKAAYLGFVREVTPRIRAAEEALRARLLETGWSAPEMATVLRQFATDHRLHRAENLPLQAEERALASRYGQIVGSLSADIDGEQLTLPALAARQTLPDRAARERAWRAGAEKMLESRPALDALFDELTALRRTIAANAGFDSYADYRWQQLGRFDYSAEDGRRLRESVLEAVVPALRRQSARRARMLGLDGLRPWDVEVNPRGAEPLRPFADAQHLAELAERMLDRVHLAAGDVVRTLRTENLLDLANRPAKAPGGYCSTLADSGRAFIFMNAVGTDDNLRTMVHESGHALHAIERRYLPWVWQRDAPMEVCELASMSMELLASPYLERESGGPYDPADALRSRIAHLERMIEFLPYMATVDGFQHWLYAHPRHTREERDQTWWSLHERYCVAADWTGLQETRASLWHHKQHIFQSPLYYIEYGIAQLGALQVWRASLEDPVRAFEDYRRALSLGGTRPLPELYAAAGARLAFEPDRVAELVEMIERHVERMDAELAALRAGSGGSGPERQAG